MNVGDPVYRYTNAFKGCYEDDQGGYSPVYLRLDTYVVWKVTKCGFWLTHDWCKDNTKPFWKRFVKNSATKKFAHATKEDAQKSFMKRKEVQISLLKRQIKDVEFALELAKRGKFEE